MRAPTAPTNKTAVVLGLLLLISHGVLGEEARRGPRFEKDVKPILEQACFQCHGSTTRESELDLRTRDALLRGGESGNAIVPGKPRQSLLLEKIVSREMPPEGPPLPAEQIAVIQRWIETGALREGEDAAAARRKLAAMSVTEADVLVSVFHSHCTVCHGKWKQEGGLDLRSRDSLIMGGKSGPGIVPGKPDESLVLSELSRTRCRPRKTSSVIRIT